MDDNTNPLRTTPSLPPRSGGVGDRGLSEADLKAQAERCPCKGANDMCVCQNAPDATTRKEWGLREPIPSGYYNLFDLLQKIANPNSDPNLDVAGQTMMDYWRREAARLIPIIKQGKIAIDETLARLLHDASWEAQRQRELRQEVRGPSANFPTMAKIQHTQDAARMIDRLVAAFNLASALADPIPEAPADEEVGGDPVFRLLADVHTHLTYHRDSLPGPADKGSLKLDVQQLRDRVFNAMSLTGRALRRSTETDKPGVREAALEEAAKVADMFAADHAKSADQFGIDRNRELHNAAKGAAQGVAFAIRALSAPLAAEQPVASDCMWADKPCTCGGGNCEQVDFGTDAPGEAR